MKVAVIGSGPAGLTAAYRLHQQNHRVEVLEAQPVVGGRTHTRHFGAGYHCDTGAGRLASFYTRTLNLFDELGYRHLYLQPRQVRGAADLLIDGELYPWPFRADTVSTSLLLTAVEKERYTDYVERLMRVQPDSLAPDLAFDQTDAESELAELCPGIVEHLMRSMFDGPFFARLRNLSASMET